MKGEKKKETIVKRFKRLKIRCELCGRAIAKRYNQLGMAICGKNHKKKKQKSHEKW